MGCLCSKSKDSASDDLGPKPVLVHGLNKNKSECKKENKVMIPDVVIDDYDAGPKESVHSVDERNAVYEVTNDGFHHKIYLMYYSAPDIPAAESIAAKKEIPIEGGVMGAGVYCTRSDEKAGPVVFKLLVYHGRIIKEENFRNNGQLTEGSVYSKERQENCIKSKKQVRILGVCQGYEQLSDEAKSNILWAPTRGWDPKNMVDAAILEELKNYHDI